MVVVTIEKEIEVEAVDEEHAEEEAGNQVGDELRWIESVMEVA